MKKGIVFFLLISMMSFFVSASPPGVKVKHNVGYEQTITDQVNIQPQVDAFICENSVVSLPYIGNLVTPTAVPAYAEILLDKFCSPVNLCACNRLSWCRKLIFLRFGGATSN